MKNKFLFYFLILGLCVASFAFIYGCGANPTSSSDGGSSMSNREGTSTYSGTQSPGDVWSWIISTETFSGTCESGLWVSGTWVTLVSGFGKATITGAGGPAGMTPPTDGSAHAYFLEFQNTMLLVRPDEADDSRVMVCAASATQEPSQGKYLYVNIPESGWDLSSPAFGTVEVSDISAGRKNFDITPYTITGEPVAGGHMSATFIYANGMFTQEAGTDATKVFMTPSGVFFGDSGPNKGGFAGASNEGITMPNFIANVLPHTYKGIRFIYYPNSSTGETEPITCSKNPATNAMLATGYANVETGQTKSQGVSITFEASSVPGFIRGYVTELTIGESQIIQCVVSQIGPVDKRKYMISGIGYEDNTHRPFNFLIIQSD